MRIQNLKAPSPPVQAVQAAREADNLDQDVVVANQDMARPDSSDRHSVEVAFLKARIQHLELVVETARSLMGANHERLLRRLHEVPRELVELGNRLRRFDPQAT